MGLVTIRKILNYIEDILIFLGMLFIVVATCFISWVAAMYVTGAFFLIIGIYFMYHPPKTDEKRR